MATKSQQPKGRDGALSSLNMAIDALNLAKEVSSIAPAKAVFGTVSILLTMIRDSMVNELDYVELGLFCADICRALDRGMNEKKLDDLNQSVCDAINQLMTTVAEIRKKVIKQSGRHAVSRFFHARNDKETITAWKSDLNRVLHVFNTELAMNTHTIVADIRQDMLRAREGTDGQSRTTQSSVPGESPPPPPRIFYGRDELIEKIVGFAERLMPIALIGVGGIGKTSTALTVLHNDRIKQRFGDNRRFIRCDQFPASLAHFLRRLSKVIGSGVGNPEDLGSLRSFLSSKEMLIVLDNAESILDPQGTDAREIYAVVEEISQLSNISLCITSRISTIPPDCKWIKIPTLSMDAARSAFYRIYEHGGRSDLVNNILEQLDFHPLSITLLATIAHHNQWDTDRLAKEWDEHRTDMLQTEHNKSLAATIELSLSSPMFRELGPEARDLLGVIAFFPQGVDESNLDWLFPTISGRKNTFDKFCVLSLTYRSDGFITMLAPLRSYLSPKDPKSSLLLCMTRDHYFTRLSVATRPHKPGFEEARWIASEDVNVEHLLDVFTSIDANSRLVWDACANFMCHIYRHKPRLTMLGPKIEGLRDDHPSKHECLHQLSQSFKSVGNCAERKRILSYILKLYRERGDERQVARALRHLSDANRRMGLREEGEGLVKEALETYEKLGHTVRQAECLSDLAWSLCDDGQLDAAEEAASRAIDLLPEKHEHLACQCHRVLGKIYRSKGDKAKAIHHLEAALRIVSSLNSHREPFWIHRSLVELFSEEGKFDDAYAHIEHARLHAGNDAYYLAQATRLQAKFRYRQGDLEEAKIEALCAVDAFEKVGATKSAKDSERLLKQIERAIKKDKENER